MLIYLLNEFHINNCLSYYFYFFDCTYIRSNLCFINKFFNNGKNLYNTIYTLKLNNK